MLSEPYRKKFIENKRIGLNLWSDSIKKYNNAYFLISGGAITISAAFCGQRTTHLYYMWLLASSWIFLIATVWLGLRLNGWETVHWRNDIKLCDDMLAENVIDSDMEGIEKKHFIIQGKLGDKMRTAYFISEYTLLLGVIGVVSFVFLSKLI